MLYHCPTTGCKIIEASGLRKTPVNRFCPYHGRALIAKVCTYCYKDIAQPQEHDYCRKCGKKLAVISA